jgi:hypothetical protein
MTRIQKELEINNFQESSFYKLGFLTKSPYLQLTHGEFL